MQWQVLQEVSEVLLPVVFWDTLVFGDTLLRGIEAVLSTIALSKQPKSPGMLAT